VSPWLLCAMADMNVKDGWGETPLHCAAAMGHVAAVQALFSAGSVVNVRSKARETPLHYAALKAGAYTRPLSRSV